MNSTPILSGSHLHTYDRIFQHPASHNLDWRAVRALLEHLGSVEEESNGNLKVTRNGQLLVLHPPRTKDVAEIDEIMTLRHFLERSQEAAPATGDKDAPWLLLIDHHEARIFRTEVGAPAFQRILPHKPEDFFRHAHNSKDFSRGREKPDPNSFFEPVAKALQAAGKILVLGSGKGSGSEMEQFVAWVKLHHPELGKRITGSLVVDEHHLSDGQLMAKARDFYEQSQVTQA